MRGGNYQRASIRRAAPRQTPLAPALVRRALDRGEEDAGHRDYVGSPIFGDWISRSSSLSPLHVVIYASLELQNAEKFYVPRIEYLEKSSSL